MAKLSDGRNPKTGQYVSAGRASDGVTILRQAAKPKHFTLTEIERTVDSVKAPSSGHYEQVRSRGGRFDQRTVVSHDPLPTAGRGPISKKER